jgi:hypothetical protein
VIERRRGQDETADVRRHVTRKSLKLGRHPKDELDAPVFRIEAELDETR